MALVMRDDLIAFTRDRLSLFLPLAELTDQKIDEIAMTLGRAFFRAGILLGLHPSEIDRIQVRMFIYFSVSLVKFID